MSEPIMDESNEVATTVSNEVVVLRKISTVPQGYIVNSSKKGFNLVSLTEHGDSTYYVEFYDSDSQKVYAHAKSVVKEFEKNKHVSKIFPAAVGLASGASLWVGELPIVVFFMSLLMLYVVAYQVMKYLVVPHYEKKRIEHLSRIRAARFIVSEPLKNSISYFFNDLVKGDVPDCLYDALRAKLTAEQSDEEIISWVDAVNGILRKDVDFPVDLIPVDNTEALDIFRRMPEKKKMKSVEHEKLALEDARVITEQLRTDSVAVHTGALVYLGESSENNE